MKNTAALIIEKFQDPTQLAKMRRLAMANLNRSRKSDDPVIQESCRHRALQLFRAIENAEYTPMREPPTRMRVGFINKLKPNATIEDDYTETSNP